MTQDGLTVVSDAPAAFRNLGASLRPVRLAPSRSGLQLYRNPYRPAMVGNTPKRVRMGALEDVPTTIGVSATGIGALLLSGILPPPIKTVMQVTGIGLIAFGAITLMTPAVSADEPVKGEEAAPPRTTPIAEAATFMQVTGAFDQPTWGSDVYTSLGGGYMTTVSLTNPTDKPVPVILKINADEKRIYGGGGYRKSDLVAQDSVVIPAMDTITESYDVELLTSGLLPYLLWAQYAIDLKLVIERQAGLTGVENIRELDQVRFQAQ